MTLQDVEEILKGGSGSGDWGHTGRPGKRGGSGGGGGKGRPRKGRRSREVLDKEIAEQSKPKVAGVYTKGDKVNYMARERGMPVARTGTFLELSKDNPKLAQILQDNGYVNMYEVSNISHVGGAVPAKAKRPPKKPMTSDDILNDKLVSYLGDVSDDKKVILKKFGDDGVKAMNSYDNFSHSGLISEIGEFHYAAVDGGDRKVFVADGVIRDKNGLQVGRFFRTMDKVNGKLVVDHYAFELDDAVQNKGFGGQFYRHNEKELAKAGVSKITLQANLSVGGYAWARMGFDFKSGFDKRELIREAKSKWRERYGNVSNMPNLQSMKPWDIASLAGPDGHRIGKEMLLDSDWPGVKDLSEGSESRKVGDAYYASKGR